MMFTKDMDKELFLYEQNPNSKYLAIIFSGVNAKSFMGYKLLDSLDCNKLFIRDNTKSWYGGDIKGLSKDSDDLTEKIKQITKEYDKNNITIIGSSMGGYASLLFGIKLDIKNIISFAPQIIIDNNLPNNPKKNDFIKYKNLTDMINNSNSNIDIFIGLNELPDLYHINKLENKNINIYKLFGQEHNVMYFLNSIDILKEYLKSKIYQQPYNLKGINSIETNYDKKILSNSVENFYIKKDYKSSLENFNDLLKTTPSLNSFWKYKGLCLFHLKRYDEALISLDKAQSIVYNDEQLHFFKGLTYLNIKNYEKAQKHLNNAIELSTQKKLKYYIKLAITYRELKKFDNALKILDESLSISKNNYGTYYQFGMIYQLTNKKDKALLNYKKALSLDPYNKRIIEKIKELS